MTADQPVETVLQVPLPDQAALHGLVARLEMFGGQILEVRREQGRRCSASELTRPGASA
ncbi:MAG TPA: hypothetical protein VLW50_20030 [Streptosporangiaceae bacterium]|nr:hypothetical protein [Streptosporangiaceae bacterium]